MIKKYLNLIYSHFNLKCKSINKSALVINNGDQFEVQMWNISSFVYKKLIPIVGCHPFPLNELCFLSACVTYLQPSFIFEWGTNIGKSARIFYEICNHYELSCCIHSIDLPDDQEHPEHPKNKRGMLVKGIDKVFLHCGDGADTSIEILKNSTLKTQKCLYFLDGDHSYQSVKRELDLIYKNNPNANFIIHDTFYQSENSGYNIGPYMAVNDFLKINTNKFQRLETNLGLPGMTLLYQLNTNK